MDDLQDRKSEVKRFFKKLISSKENYLLIGILVFAFIIRLYFFLKTYNQAVWWDAADYLTAAKVLGKNLMINYEWDPRRPFLMALLWGLILKLGGTEVWLRVTELIFSMFAVYLTFLVGKEMYSKKVGLIASFCLSVFWLHLFFTNRLLVELPAMAFWLLTVLYFWKGYAKDKGTKYYYLFGLAFGLTLLTRGASALMFIPLLLFVFLKDQLDFLWNKKLWVSVLIAIIVMTPFFLFIQFKYGGNAVSSYAGVSEGRFSQRMGLSGLLVYAKFFPTYLQTAFLVVFLIGLAFFLFNLLLSFDLIIRRKEKKLDADLFVFLWVLIPYLFFSIMVVHMEPRYLIYAFPGFFLILARGFVEIEKITNKYHKHLGLAIIVVLLLVGGYAQVQYANQTIMAKATSYQEVKEAGLWIKENSESSDIIISHSVPQHMYYAERSVYMIDFQDDFEEQIQELKPKYMVVSVFERSPEWFYQYPANHQDLLKPVKVYTQGDQPVLVIYEFQWQS